MPDPITVTVELTREVIHEAEPESFRKCAIAKGVGHAVEGSTHIEVDMDRIALHLNGYRYTCDYNDYPRPVARIISRNDAVKTIRPTSFDITFTPERPLKVTNGGAKGVSRKQPANRAAPALDCDQTYTKRARGKWKRVHGYKRRVAA